MSRVVESKPAPRSKQKADPIIDAVEVPSGTQPTKKDYRLIVAVQRGTVRHELWVNAAGWRFEHYARSADLTTRRITHSEKIGPKWEAEIRALGNPLPRTPAEPEPQACVEPQPEPFAPAIAELAEALAGLVEPEPVPVVEGAALEVLADLVAEEVVAIDPEPTPAKPKRKAREPKAPKVKVAREPKAKREPKPKAAKVAKVKKARNPRQAANAMIAGRVKAIKTARSEKGGAL